VVVFGSFAGNLVPNDGGSADVFLYTIATGTLARVSAPTGGGEPDGHAFNADVSNDGRYVTFESSASNLVPGDTTGFDDVFVRDMQANRITRVSVTSAGGEAVGDSYLPAISANGCQIAFFSVARNLVAGDAVDGVKTFVRDQCAGTTEIASLGNGNPAPQATVLDERAPAISDDGCLVGMISSGLVPSQGLRATVVRDRCLGFTFRADVSTGGDGGNLHTNGVAFSAGSARYVVFHSTASNLVLGDTNGANDVFVRDRGNAAAPIATLAVTVSGRHVVADASGSSDADAGIASVSIAFGDGTPAAAGSTAGHDYAQSGTFTVTATVTDLDGLSASATRAVTIAPTGGGNPPPPPPPVIPPATPPSSPPVAPVLVNAAVAPRGFASAPSAGSGTARR
jgi:hypothetical protein